MAKQNQPSNAESRRLYAEKRNIRFFHKHRQPGKQDHYMKPAQFSWPNGGPLCVAILLFALSPGSAPAASPSINTGPGPVRILCIGDSITQGGQAGREEYTYRWPLFCMLKDAGIGFDFIGSRRKGVEKGHKWPRGYKGAAFDSDHEGYYGGKTAAVRANLAASLPGLPAPDVALVHLGTNDQKSADYRTDVIRPLEEIVRMLRAKNPKVVILVGHLNFNDVPGTKMRPQVEQMVNRLNTKESPVIAVRHYKGWNERPGTPDSDTFDWVHPNPQGQRKMAAKWFEAMKPYLPAASQRANLNGKSD